MSDSDATTTTERMTRVECSDSDWRAFRALAIGRGTTAQRLLGELVARELGEEGTTASATQVSAAAP